MQFLLFCIINRSLLYKCIAQFERKSSCVAIAILGICVVFQSVQVGHLTIPCIRWQNEEDENKSHGSI